MCVTRQQQVSDVTLPWTYDKNPNPIHNAQKMTDGSRSRLCETLTKRLPTALRPHTLPHRSVTSQTAHKLRIWQRSDNSPDSYGCDQGSQKGKPSMTTSCIKSGRRTVPWDYAHCALLFDLVLPKEPLGIPLPNAPKFRSPKLP